jgi:hypothetical protein
MPNHVREISPTYTYSGKVLVLYQSDRDPEVQDYWNVAVVNDDGNDFRAIFSGVIPRHKKANGIRHMPFQDNRRVLLGDYVVECTPDIDTCTETKLVPIRYPWLITRDPRTTRHWSEIIIAPDNEHMAWTILRTDIGAANVLGRLTRRRNHYVIRGPEIISSLDFLRKDPTRPGYGVPQPIRGGEVKQFVRGGAAISLAGAKDTAVTDSVVQDLASNEVVQITRTPGYDETTIFSPDERLGLVMTTRGSERTNPAIFGLMPRPHATLTSAGIIPFLYMYAVAGVRSFREGNVGPALIEVERSKNEPGYRGVLLNDSGGDWVYVSPMSWHPAGTKAMWPETLRGSHQSSRGRTIRVRKAELRDYGPSEPVPHTRTPGRTPYGIHNGLRLWFPPDNTGEVRIAGASSGHIELKRSGRKPLQSMMGSTESRYVNYSDDGANFYNGFIRVSYSPVREGRYEADLGLSGKRSGSMKFRATFSGIAGPAPVRLLFDAGEDGKPKSYGYAEYDGTRLNVEDLLP